MSMSNRNFPFKVTILEEIPGRKIVIWIEGFELSFVKTPDGLEMTSYTRDQGGIPSSIVNTAFAFVRGKMKQRSHRRAQLRLLF